MTQQKYVFNTSSENRKVSIFEYAKGHGFEAQETLDQFNQGTFDETKFDALHALNWLKYTIRPQTSENPDLKVATELWGRLYECAPPQFKAMLRMLLPEYRGHQECPIQRESALWIETLQNVWAEAPDMQLVDTLMNYIHDDILALKLVSSNMEDIKKLATYDIEHRIANNLDTHPLPGSASGLCKEILQVLHVHTNAEQKEQWQVLELLDVANEDTKSLLAQAQSEVTLKKMAPWKSTAQQHTLRVSALVLLDYLCNVAVTLQQQPQSFTLPEQLQETAYQA